MRGQDGTIAGPTGGYPYFGWYGYPLVPYRYCELDPICGTTVAWI